MTVESNDQKPKQSAAGGQRLVLFGMLWGLVWPAFLGVMVFAAAGTWRWPQAWAYLVLYSAILIFGSFTAIHRDPEFTSERTQVKEGTKRWDRLLSGPLFSPLWLGLYVVAGLDQRSGWSPDIGPVAIAGVVLAGLGYLLAVWAMASNRFYGRYARIQTDRGHTVVTSGPYRYVRHPGYAGLCAFMLATPLALESLYALIPAVLVVAVLVVRTALEDRMLLEELPGYEAYARQTRFRLLPGVW
jgi:protein-S-isoprenylcysteine O-methyltransferase Ste14